MKTIRVVLGAACLVLLSSAARAQTVQTFEDFSPCDNILGNVGLYGGVNYLSQWTCFSFPQSGFDPHSGTNRVYASTSEGNAASGSFTFAPIPFSGAWFAGSAGVTFQLFLGANLVATSGTLATSAVPMFLSSGYSGTVDRVRVVGTSELWVMDDVTFNTVSVTPEPASILLVASGLAMIGGAHLRRRRRVRTV